MTSVVLTWTDPTTLADGTTPIPTGDFGQVNILRSTDNGATFANIGHVAPGAQSFTDSSVSSPNTYQYEVTAQDTQTPPTNSMPSNVVTIVLVPTLQPLAAPTALAAVTGP